jgi:hydroxylamine reductase
MENMAAVTAVQKKLLGALIGLGRAVEGNPNRPTELTHQVMLTGLQMTISTICPEVLQMECQIERLHGEKNKLAVQCLTCEKQCGRNDDFDIGAFGRFPDSLRWRKATLLALGQSVAYYCQQKPVSGDLYNQSTDFLYDALFLIGSTQPEQVHQTCMERGGEILIELMETADMETDR